MTNLQRLLLECQGIELSQEEASIYLQENNLNHFDEYVPTSNTNKRAILKTALSVLESIANNPTLMRSYKSDDMTISDFATNLQNRIDQLDRKIRQLPTSEYADSSFFMLFSK